MKQLTLFIIMLAALCSCSRLEPQNVLLIYKNSDGTKDTVTVTMQPQGDRLALNIAREDLTGVDTLVVLPEFAHAQAGEKGSWQ